MHREAPSGLLSAFSVGAVLRCQGQSQRRRAARSVALRNCLDRRSFGSGIAYGGSSGLPAISGDWPLIS